MVIQGEDFNSIIILPSKRFPQFCSKKHITSTQFPRPSSTSQFRLDMKCQGHLGWPSRNISKMKLSVAYLGNQMAF